MLLSIDVGIRNLAICAIDEITCEIQHWDCGGVPPQHSDGLFLSLRKYLDERPWLLHATTVLIEKQPIGKNKKMASVENFLHAYFLIKVPEADTIIYDAKHKVTDCVGAGKEMYKKRKNAAIERCWEFLNEEGDVNRHWLPLFNESKKKDDLSDTVMMALSFIRRVEPRKATASKKKKPTKLIPRRPNENQKNTKYSKCNLAWLVLNDPERIKLKRFEKDLKRYFKSMDELEAAMGVKSMSIE
ncbi:MAG: hypothetical protein CMB57_00120 [Euryarchaeota archaeon]|nr:hypothetical protein [Euryarchaeota archaeon]|tara:strand:- start:53 stop:781 length:729 start_codon:yes stop_codon:yes gene_type:complete